MNKEEALHLLQKNAYESKGCFRNLNVCESSTPISGGRYFVVWDDEIDKCSKYNSISLKIIAYRIKGIGEVIHMKN